MAWHATSRHERGYGSKWDKLRLRALRRDGHMCMACRKAEATHVDHITRKADGGTDGIDNLQSLCAPCHHEKTRRENTGRAYSVAVGVDGWPIDPMHPSNR